MHTSTIQELDTDLTWPDGVDPENWREMAELEFEPDNDEDTPIEAWVEELIGFNPDEEGWEDPTSNFNPNHDNKGKFAKGAGTGKVSATAMSAISKETLSPNPTKAYRPDVHHDSDKDGITDAARVGVPGHIVPPPPKIQPLPNLTPHERKIEKEFLDFYQHDPDGVAKRFRDIAVKEAGDGPPTFGTDDAKVLHPMWAGEGMTQNQRSEFRATANVVLHQTANAITKHAFIQHLDTLKKGDEVLVTVGGCGAGKGYALKNVDKTKGLKKQVKAVWDSAGDQNATENPWIQSELQKRGLVGHYVYVHADPQVSWAHPEAGVIQRANNPKDGRMVDADVFADSYAIGARNHQKFMELNSDNPAAKFYILQNNIGESPKELSSIPADALKLDRKELAKFARKKVVESSAPAHIKRGATIGDRIWGLERHAA